jgi:hypothetical protein
MEELLAKTLKMTENLKKWNPPPPAAKATHKRVTRRRKQEREDSEDEKKHEEDDHREKSESESSDREDEVEGEYNAADEDDAEDEEVEEEEGEIEDEEFEETPKRDKYKNHKDRESRGKTHIIAHKDLESSGANPQPAGEGDLIDKIKSKYVEPDTTGPAIAENLAALAESFLKSVPPKEKVQQLQANLARPENVESMTTPHVNTEVWSKLEKPVKDRDLTLQTASKNVMGALSAFTQIAGKLSALAKKCPKIESELTEMAAISLDGLQIGALAAQNITQARRECIRPNLAPAYRKICNAPKEERFDLHLFGDDLPEKLKAVEQQDQVVEKITYPNNSSTAPNPFLGRAGRPQRGSKALRGGPGRNHPYSPYQSGYQSYQSQYQYPHQPQQRHKRGGLGGGLNKQRGRGRAPWRC